MRREGRGCVSGKGGKRVCELGGRGDGVSGEEGGED